MATKRWAERSLQGKEPIHVIGALLKFTYTTNSGAAFSLATNATLFLSSFALKIGRAHV